MIAALLALSLSANAANVYVNGTPVDGLKSFEFKNVSVQVDENGDVFIIAPQYNVALGAEATKKKSSKRKDVTTPPTPSGDGTVSGNRWWMIAEDNGSKGHVVDVEVNGTVIRTYKSGEAMIFDVGPYLNTGSNAIRFVSRGFTPAGGSLFLYLGTGSVDGGRVSQDEPKIKFKRNGSSPAKDEISYTLQVD
jgi:hypothetical protein